MKNTTCVFGLLLVLVGGCVAISPATTLNIKMMLGAPCFIGGLAIVMSTGLLGGPAYKKPDRVSMALLVGLIALVILARIYPATAAALFELFGKGAGAIQR